MENAAFEKAAADSLKTMEGLNKTINGLDGSKAFSGLQAAANNLNLSNIADNVQTIADRFSNLGIVGMAVLTNLANKAVDVGAQLAKSFTIDPLVQGFQEYELKMDSIKVTLNNTGRPLEDVKATLEDLNKYADDTIYSFSDMTTAMGLFTTQGIGLEDAAAAIKGVSNLAAITGANSEQASRAMFNFAQALATGKMMLVDWKTMENTGMGNARFKDELLEEAWKLGKFDPETLYYYGNNQVTNGAKILFDIKRGAESFRDTLKYGWIDNEVMINTLKNYADETTEIGKAATEAAREVTTFSKLIDTLQEGIGSGWGQTFEYIIGDYGEAKELWTNVSNYLNDMVNQMSDARNNALEVWHNAKGRDMLIQSVKNMVDGVVSVIQPIRTAWENVFGAFDYVKVGQKLASWTKDLMQFTSHMKLSDTASNNLRKTFQGLFDILKVGIDAFKLFLNVVKPVASVLGAVLSAMLEGFLGVTGAIGSFVSTIINAVRESGFFQNIVKSISDTIAPLAGSIKEFGIKAYRSFADLMGGAENAGEAVANFVLHIGNLIKDSPYTKKAIDVISEAFKKAVDFIDNFLFKSGNLQKAFDYVKDHILAAKDAIVKFVQDAGGVEGIFEKISDKLGKATQKVKDFISSLTSGKFDATKSFSDNLSALMDKLPKFSDILDKAKNAVTNFFKPFTESGIGKSFKTILDSLGKFVSNVGTAIVNGFKNFSWDSIGTILEGGILSAIGIGIARIANNLATFIKQFNKDTGGLKKAIKETIESFSGVLDTLGDTLSDFQGKIKADVLMRIAQAIGILAASIFGLSLIDGDKLYQGIIGIASAMTTLVVAFKIVTNSINAGEFAAAGTAAGLMIGLATAILELSFAVGNLAKYDMNEISRGVIAIGALVLILRGINKTFSAAGDTIKTIGSLIGFASTVKALAKVVASLGEIDEGKIKQGLISLGVIIGELTVFVIAYGKLNGAALDLKGGAALIEVGITLKILAGVVELIGTMQWYQALAGVVGLGFIMTELAAFCWIANKVEFSAKTAASLLILSAAIAAFTADIAILGHIDIISLAKGVVGLGFVLTELIAFVRVAKAGPDIAAVCASMILLASAILILTPPIIAFALIPSDKLTVAVIAVGFLLTVMGAIATYAQGTIAGAAAITILSAAIVLLTPALIALSAVPFPNLAGGLVILLGAMLGLSAIATILPGVIPLLVSLGIVLGGLGTFLIGFGAAAAGFGVGVALVTSSLLAMAMLSDDAAINIVKAFEAIGIGINVCAIHIGTAIAEALTAFSAALIEGAPIIEEAAILVGHAIVTGFTQVLPEIIQAIFDGTNQLLVTFTEGGSQIIANLVNLIVTLVDTLGAQTDVLVAAAMVLAANFLNGMAVAIIENGDLVMDALENLCIAMVDFIAAALENILGNIPIVGDKIAGAIRKFREANVAELNPTDAMTTGQAYAEALGRGVEQGGISSGHAATKLGQDMKQNTLNDLALLPGETSSLYGMLSGLITGESGNAGSAASIFGQTVHDGTMGPINELPTSIDGIFMQLPGIMDGSFTKMTDTASTGSQNISTAMTDGIVNLPFEYSDEFEQLPPIVTETTDAMATEAEAGAQATHDAFFDPMTMLPEDLEKIMGDCPGIISGIGPEMTSAADGVSSDVVSTFNSYTPEWTADMNEKTDSYVSTMESGSSRASQTAQTWAENVLEKLKSKDGEWEKSATANTTNYTNAISNAQPKATQASTNFANSAFKPLSDKAPEWPKQGTKDSTAYSDAISKGAEGAEKASKSLSDSAVKGLSSNTKEFEKTGKESGDAYVGGIDNSGRDAEDAGRRLGESAYDGADSMSPQFVDIGEDMGDGLIKGLENKRKAISDKAADIVADAIDSAMKEADIHSPSKKTEFIGEMMDEGLIRGYKELAPKVTDEAAYVIDASLLALAASLSKVSDMVNEELDMSPVITPVIDLSSVRSGVGAIDTLMTDVGTIDTDSVRLNIGKASTAMSLNKGSVDLEATGQNGSEPSVVNINMNQTNVSPKALDPFQVYRQTRNQLSQVRDAILKR